MRKQDAFIKSVTFINTHSRARTIIPTGYLALSFYIFGCLVLENDVNYSTWRVLTHTDFSVYHELLENQLKVFLFLPMAVHLAFNILLFWFRPREVKMPVLILLLLINIYVVAESLLVQVPVHAELQRQWSLEAVNRLIYMHRFYRLPAEIFALILNFYLLARIIHKTNQFQEEPRVNRKGTNF